jgi:hypothetical protein
MPGFIVNGLGAGANSTPKPLYSYTWELGIIQGISSLSGALIYAKTASLPSWSFEIEKNQGASLDYKYASKIVWEDIRISWYDVDGLTQIMKRWRDSVWTPSTGIKPASQYKADSWLTHFTYDLSVARPWHIMNGWPKAVKSSELTYTDSDFHFIDVTFTYDAALEEGGASSAGVGNISNTGIGSSPGSSSST